MSNRSNSFLKRFKTQKTDRSAGFSWKALGKTPTNHPEYTSRSPVNKCDRWQKVELIQRDNYIIKCVNHPLKRALFEPKQSLTDAYCQDCSIKLVKSNFRMIKITEESLYLRALLEAQLQKMNVHEEQVRQLVSKHFELQREIVKLNFIRAKQHEKVVNIPYFKLQLPSLELNSKMKEVLGSINFKKIEFVRNNVNNQIHHVRNPTRQLDFQLLQTLNSSNKQNHDFEGNMTSKTTISEIRARRIQNRETQKSVCMR